MLIPAVKDIEQIVEHPDKLLTIKQNATIAEAAKRMTDNQVGCLLVFDQADKFVGVLTERDMLAKVLTASREPEKTLVKDIMTYKVISCTMDTTIANVEQLMSEHKIRHVPIVEDGIPIGIVSTRDTIAYRLHTNKAMKTAAEQIAMLSTGLKSLDFDDVIALAINEVPESFEADRAILCFEQGGSSPPIIRRKGCPLSQKKLLDPTKLLKLSRNPQVICDKITTDCAELGDQTHRVIIPLTIDDQYNDCHSDSKARQGFLCMCWMNKSLIGSEKLQLYKASLLRDVLNVNLTNAMLYQNYQKARRDSQTDPLTGVGTRRVLDRVLKVEHARALRYNHSFSVAIVDMDDFKQINDTAGHAVGDRALKQLAQIMLQNIRKTDIIITRYGGDEFVLVMPETRLSGAKILLERLRRQVKTISLPKVRQVTVSCGVAEWSASDANNAEAVLKRADSALYEAKNKGRNRVIVSEPI